LRRSRNVPLTLALAAALALIFTLVLASPAAALEQKLTASDGAAGDWLGNSVAIDGDTLVVGASYGNAKKGAVYIYQRLGDSWTQTAKLTASDGTGGDLLGYSLAIDGDTIVAGAPDDSGGTHASRGSVYTFARTGAAARTETAKLTASDGGEFHGLGQSVAIDGDTIVAGGNQGSVYTFARTGAAARTETAKLTASDGAAGDGFGRSVAIEGDTIVAGAWTDDVGANANQGSVYTFARTGAAARTETAKLTASDGAESDHLGYSLAIDGDTIVAGAWADDGTGGNQGSVYNFARTGAAARTETAKLTASDGAFDDSLGSSVAIDGDTIVAGAVVDDVGANSDQGSVYTFARTGAAARTETAKLTASDGAAGDGFGRSVAIDEDTIVAGAVVDDVGDNVDQGSASVFFAAADADDDGLPDGSDSCPAGDTGWTSNATTDNDSDGCRDAGEDTDDDNDTVADGSDNCPTTSNANQTNTDEDAQGDACDSDDDNDTVADGSDNCPTTSNTNQTNTDGDAQGDACDADDDNDGKADGSDSCPGGNTGWTSNSTTDLDSDGCRDSTEDTDDDNDTVADGSDNCQTVANLNQANQDGDALGDACDNDNDNDTVGDGSDNCPTTSNTNQTNTDGDAQGDACDSDDDNDTLSDGSDQCRALPASTPSGCPDSARSLTLSYSAKKDKFKGKLTALESSCVDEDLVSVWKKVRGDDKRVGRDEVNVEGKYSVPEPRRPGKYYSTVEERIVPDLAACGSATSPTLQLR
jgi:hypothetical protein